MRSTLFIISFALLFLLFPCTDSSEAARHGKTNPPPAAEQSRQAPTKPAAVSGQTVKTDYFSVLLPKDWFMAYPISKKKTDVAAVFSNDKTHVTVTLNIIRAPLTVKQLADLTIGSMKKSGLSPSQPRPAGKMYKVMLKGKANGEAWFAANGKICSATVILAPQSDIHSANDFLASLRSAIGDMFPTSLN